MKTVIGNKMTKAVMFVFILLLFILTGCGTAAYDIIEAEYKIEGMHSETRRWSELQFIPNSEGELEQKIIQKRETEYFIIANGGREFEISYWDYQECLDSEYIYKITRVFENSKGDETIRMKDLTCVLLEESYEQ